MSSENEALENGLQDGAWRTCLEPEFRSAYFQTLNDFYAERISDGHEIYPAKENIFAAFNLTPLDAVKVVILGQDPYHGPGQAMGLSFSVPEGIKIPPSLRNIYKEITADLGAVKHNTGDLTEWARQGVLLLNSVLTVEDSQAGSHRGQGWEAFTDAAIRCVSEAADPCVFMLWGGWAKTKTPLIDTDKHVIFTTSHPSPLSAYRGFNGCGHFSAANAFLEKNGREKIVW